MITWTRIYKSEAVRDLRNALSQKASIAGSTLREALQEALPILIVLVSTRFCKNCEETF